MPLRIIARQLSRPSGLLGKLVATPTTSRPFLKITGVVRLSRSNPSSALGTFSLNRSGFKIERDHFMHRNRGHIDGDKAVLIRERN
jgi:hypothetical protein